MLARNARIESLESYAGRGQVPHRFTHLAKNGGEGIHQTVKQSRETKTEKKKGKIVWCNSNRVNDADCRGNNGLSPQPINLEEIVHTDPGLQERSNA